MFWLCRLYFWASNSKQMWVTGSFGSSTSAGEQPLNKTLWAVGPSKHWRLCSTPQAAQTDGSQRPDPDTWDGLARDAHVWLLLSSWLASSRLNVGEVLKAAAPVSSGFRRSVCLCVFSEEGGAVSSHASRMHLLPGQQRTSRTFWTPGKASLLLSSSF